MALNYFARYIGILYKDESWARRTYSEIINRIPNEAIKMEYRNSITSTIKLKDDSTIMVTPCNSLGRTLKFHEIYMQIGIEYDIYKKIIRYNLLPQKLGGSTIFIINNPEDLEFDRKIAESYYKELEV